MTWTKLSDDFSDDCWELSDAAIRLHIEGLVWSNRKLLDCRLRKEDMVRWAKRPGAANELVNAGWWRDEGSYYAIVHHATYQRGRDAVLKQQEANQRNGRKGGRPPREQAGDLPGVRADRVPLEETQLVSDSVSDSRTERDGTGRAWNTEVLDSETQPLASDSVTGGNQEEVRSQLLVSDSVDTQEVSVGWTEWRGQGSSPFEEYR